MGEEARGKCIESLHDIDFTYDGWTPDVQIARWGEGVDRKNPFVYVKFLPTSRTRFKSISDLIGDATENGAYQKYGYAQVEDVWIRCYSGETVNDRNIDGRLFAYSMAEKVLQYVLRNWESLLIDYGACFDQALLNPTIRDDTRYRERRATRTHVFEFDLYLLTQLRWDYVPSDWDGDEHVLKGIGEIDEIKNLELNN